jgi:hypothetical protein
MNVSPAVDVAVNIRKDLAEFQRTSSKEALRAEMRKACEEALWGQTPDLSFMTEYLEQRQLIRDARRASRRLHRRALRLVAPVPSASAKGSDQ